MRSTHNSERPEVYREAMRKVELSGLTGIRFYAAFFVYLHHIVLIPGMTALSGSSLLFNAGDVGVSFFFVLSGFILTLQLRRRISGWRLLCQLPAVCLGPTHEDLSRPFPNVRAGAAHRDLQPAAAP